MDKFHFTTVLSETHLYKLVPMYISLKRYCKNFKLFILCANDSVFNILNKINFEDIILIRLEEVENFAKSLKLAKENRTFHEYCWTLKPVLLYYIMKRFNSAKYFAHLDSDLFFFSTIDEVFNEKPNATIFLTDHRNSEEFKKYYELSGIYNTGFVGFRNCVISKNAAKLWMDRCIKKCTAVYDKENKTFGDQRYVEDWPEIFPGVHIINSIGANAAFWNIKQYRVSNKDKSIYLNDEKLLFYHYSGVSILGEREFDLSYYYHIDDNNTLKYIYIPYIKILSEGIKNMKIEFPWFNSGFIDKSYIPNNHNYILN